MTPDKLSYFAGFALSVVFKYFPWVNTWYAGLAKVYKQLIMLGLLFVTGFVLYGFSCLGFGDLFGVELQCTAEGLWTLLLIIFQAAAANIATYLHLPDPKSVRMAKERRNLPN